MCLILELSDCTFLFYNNLYSLQHFQLNVLELTTLITYLFRLESRCYSTLTVLTKYEMLIEIINKCSYVSHSF